jgi:hypothetical protein
MRCGLSASKRKIPFGLSLSKRNIPFGLSLSKCKIPFGLSLSKPVLSLTKDLPLDGHGHSFSSIETTLRQAQGERKVRWGLSSSKRKTRFGLSSSKLKIPFGLSLLKLLSNR